MPKEKGRYPNRLRELRKKAGLSQRDIAAEIHIGQSGYSSVETGVVEISPDKMERLCAVLNCTPADILPAQAAGEYGGKPTYTLRGDYMAPDLLDGDLLVYDNNSSFNDLPDGGTGFVIVSADGAAVARDYYRTGDTIYLSVGRNGGGRNFKVFLTPTGYDCPQDVSLIGICCKLIRNL